MAIQKKQIHVQVPLLLWREGDRYVAYTPAFELSSCGDSEKEAIKNFGEAVELFLETAEERSVTKDLLESLGWELVRGNVRPPSAPLGRDRSYEVSMPLSLAA